MKTWCARPWLGLVLVLLAACAPAAPAPAKPPPAAAPPGPAAPAPPGSAPAAPVAAQPAATPVAPLTPPVSLTIGSTLTLGESALYIAIERGYFEAEGLTIEIEPFASGANMIAPLAAGQLDAGGGATSAGLFNAMARAVDIIIVSGAGMILPPRYDPSTFMVRKDLVDSGQVRDYADWRGRTIAASGEGNITTIAIGKALERGGLTRDDVNIVTMGFGDMLPAFANRSLDAGFLAEPFVTNAAERDIAVRWRPVSDVLGEHMVTVWMYSRKLIQEQPEAGRRLMVGLMKGARDYMTALEKGQGRAEVIAALIKHTRVKDPALYDRMSYTAVSPTGEVHMESLRDGIAWYQANGYLEAAPDLSRVVDHRFVEYARERLGPYQP